MAKTTQVEIRLSNPTFDNLHEVARLSGVKPETVIKVLLALYCLKTQAPATQPERDGRGT